MNPKLNILDVLGNLINLRPINAMAMENIVLYNDKAYLVGSVVGKCQGLLAKLDARLVNGEINTKQYDIIK